MTLQKILFPLYNKERHGFLLQKWWFRTIILAYFIWLPVSPFYIGFTALDMQVGWCYDSSQALLSLGEFDIWREQFDECQIMAREAWSSSIIAGVVGAPILNILVQFLFFKVIMDFIVLGVRFKPKGS